MQTDPWTWVAHYTDGSTLEEGDNGFADVDLSRLAAFELVPLVDGLARPVVRITPAIRPIFFRRRSITVNPMTGEEKGRSVIHCLGWQSTVEGHNVSSYTFFFEDGSVLVTDNERDVG